MKRVAMRSHQSAFAGWASVCSGTGDCVVTMDAAKSVTATFTLIARKHYTFLPIVANNFAP